jgi:hypothetical protein
MAQITRSGTRRCHLGILLNGTSTANFSFFVSYRSGSVTWTSMQAYAVQGRLIELPGLDVCFCFLIETITKRNEWYLKLHSLNIFKGTFRCFRGKSSFSSWNFVWIVRQLDPLIAFHFKIVWPQKKAPDGSTMYATWQGVVKGYEC